MKSYPPVKEVTLGSRNGTINSKKEPKEKVVSSTPPREMTAAVLLLLAIILIPVGVLIEFGLGWALIMLGAQCGGASVMLGMASSSSPSQQSGE